MLCDELVACHDPLVQLVEAQAYALKLLKRGLRPKQVAIITELSNKRVNRLREGLMPLADRIARPPLSVSTILRQADLRAASSLFISIYERVTACRDVDRPDWDLFLESYDIYATQNAIVANGFGGTWPVLSIEDACTLIMSHGQDQLEAVPCQQHGIHYLTIPDHNRGWRCPHCTRAVRGKTTEKRSSPAVVARTEPDFGVRAGNSDDGERRRVGAWITEDRS